MASIYKAYQASMDRYVAVKILPKQLAAEESFVARFRQEARILAQLQHPHILPVHDFGEAEGYTYLVMTFVRSGTLADLLQEGMLPLEQVVRIISQVGDALDYAHSQGLIHRDVKPSNILLDERGNCLLTDFGIAKIYEGATQLTGTGSIIGTPTYMSPEQGRGEKVDARSDLYSLGVVLYEMVTGRAPYQAETPVALLLKHIQAPLPPPRSLNPALPEPVEQVVLKAMAKQPEDRFATAGQMVKALQASMRGVYSGQTVIESAESALGRATAIPRWFFFVGAVALLLLCLVPLGVWAISDLLAGADPAVTMERPAAGSVATVTTTPLSALRDTPTSTPTTTVAPTATPTPSPTAMPTATSSPAATSIPLPRLSPTTSPNLLGWRTSEAPTIDGNLEEWGDISAYVATHRTHQDVSWDGTEDLVPVWQIKWDDRFFYFGVAVSDDRHVQTRQDDQVYRGDSVEIQLDTDPFTDAGVTELSPDDFQIILSPGDFQNVPPVAVRLRGDFPGRFQVVPGHNIIVDAQPAAGGYMLEAAIPWSDLNVTPRAGLIMGAVLNCTDNDTPGTAVQEVVMSSIESRRYADPTTWGMITLIDR